MAFLGAALALVVFTPEAQPQPQAQPQAQPLRTEALKACQTVSAKSYNKRLRIRRQITGNDQRFASRPVCVAKWRKLLRSIDKQRQSCKRSAVRTTASVYGGSGDDNGIGYRGDRLFNYSDSFAELSNPGTLDFAALGGLPYRAVRWAHRAGLSARGVKRDVGKGGPGLGGTKRGFDAHRPLANKLGFSGLAIVTLTAKPCRGVF